jgi:polyribonucleotide nucleotidyltransferase
MSTIVPPLDFIPSLPGKAVTKVIEELNTQTDNLLNQVSITIQDAIKLPSNSKCNDPRVEKIKQSLQEIQEVISKIQEAIPKIQTTINAVKTVITTANEIKSAIAAAQLANTATAGLFVAQQLTAIQDATIVNAIASLDQFVKIPDTLVGKITPLVPPILAALQKVSNSCNGEVDSFEIPELSIPQSNTNVNDLLKSQFYQPVNVSDDDLDNRAQTIDDLVQQQRDLLTSLLEAPSQVFKQPGPPSKDLGKSGDYYLDIENNVIYGPKLTGIDWGAGVKY